MGSIQEFLKVSNVEWVESIIEKEQALRKENQLAFNKDKSCFTNILDFESISRYDPIDTIYLNFQQAFY